MKLFRFLKVWVVVLMAYSLHRRGWTTRVRAKKGHCVLCGRKLGKPWRKFCPKQRCQR